MNTTQQTQVFVQFSAPEIKVAAQSIAEQRYVGNPASLPAKVPQTTAQAEASAQASVAVETNAPPPPREVAQVPPASSVPTGDQSPPGMIPAPSPSLVSSR